MLSNRTLKHQHWGVLIFSMFCFLLYGSSLSAKSKSKAEAHHAKQKRLKVKAMTEYEGAWVANLETDIYQLGTFENLSAGYSAQNNWDISLSLLNVQVIGDHNRFQGEPFVNISRTFSINKKFDITVGSLNGLTVDNSQPQLWLNFTFLDNNYDITPWFTCHGGPYIANAAITGTVRQIGFLTGIEIGIIPNKLELHIDYVSGHHALSGANVTMLVNITSLWQIYFGVLVPEQNSGNEFAGVLGLNLSTHPL